MPSNAIRGWTPVFRKGSCSIKMLERPSIQPKTISLWREVNHRLAASFTASMISG
jgi:hypothetical protein